MSTLCLCMIVKDEAQVIARCLDSVRRLVGHWVVVDTGSTDATRELVRRHLEGIPGELHDRPWKNFAHNRNEAIELARGKADHLLVVDADDVLEVPDRFSLPDLTLDSYELRVEDSGYVYYRTHLFRSDLDFRYEGVLHEVLRSPSPRSVGRLEGIVYRRLGGGARSADPGRFRKDAGVLEDALRADPGNARHAFYLAQSWRDAGELERALVAYHRRVALGGWPQEVWMSLFEIARLLERLGRDDDSIITAYLRAHQYRPQRAEALCELARYCRSTHRFALAHVFARAAIEIPRPADTLFVVEAVYTWRSLDEYAIASYYVGRHDEAIAANERLLSNADLPASERERVRNNLAFSVNVSSEGRRPGC